MKQPHQDNLRPAVPYIIVFVLGTCLLLALGMYRRTTVETAAQRERASAEQVAREDILYRHAAWQEMQSRKPPEKARDLNKKPDLNKKVETADKK